MSDKFTCEMGVKMPRGERCPDCGAMPNQNCGKWVTWAADEVKKVQALTEEKERLLSTIHEWQENAAALERECWETTATNVKLRMALEHSKTTIKRYHQWHCNVGEVTFTEDDVTLNLSEEYGDSTLYEQAMTTLNTIAGALSTQPEVKDDE